jgi:hypothetical protein
MCRKKSPIRVLVQRRKQRRRIWGRVILFSSLFILSCKNPVKSLPDDEIFADVDTLELVFEIGEEFGDSTNTFWSISSADIDDQGRIFVLDDVEASARVFNLNGTYMQNLTRRGSGPGELQLPRHLTVAPDGRIIISDIAKSGFIIFNDSLEFVEELLQWGDNSPYSIAALTNSKYLVCRYSEAQLSDDFVLRHTASIYDFGSTDYPANLYTDSIIVSGEVSDESNSIELVFVLFKQINSSCDSAGNVYIAPSDTLEYRVYGWDSLGNQFMSIHLDISPVEKQPEEIQAEAFYMATCYRRTGGWPPWEPSPYSHRFMTAELGIGPDQNLWVRRGTRNDLFFDIFDFDGNLVKHAVYRQESWSWKTVITLYGILAWELDPLDGYQKLFLFR